MVETRDHDKIKVGVNHVDFLNQSTFRGIFAHICSLLIRAHFAAESSPNKQIKVINPLLLQRFNYFFIIFPSNHCTIH